MPIDFTAIKDEKAFVQKWLAIASHYIKTHRNLLFVIVAASLAWGITGKVESMIAAHDKAAYTAAHESRVEQAGINEELAKKSAADIAQMKVLVQEVSSQNAQLEQTNATLLLAMKKQQTNDATLPPTDLAQRIEILSGLPASTLAITPGALSVPNGAAVQIAQTLEQIPALKGELSNTQNEKSNDDKVISQQTTTITGLGVEIDGLHSEIKKADAECVAQIKVVKDQANKSKRKWFIVGYIAGLSTRGAIKILGGF